MRKHTRFIIEFAILCMLAIFVNIAGTTFEAAQAEYAVELATKQMEIEGSQEYSVYHDTVQYYEEIYVISKVVFATTYIGFTVEHIVECIRNKQEK